MPQRSNEFQRLVKTIYEQVAPEGADVRESALIREESSGLEREIDILIEHKVADSKIRIAVETCDEGRPASVAWIDELLGKYGRLRVDRVVAVSRSGFSRSAHEKALAHFIEPKTLQEALNSDWSGTLIRIGAVKVIDRNRWDELGLVTEPPISVAPPLDIMVCDQEGRDVGSLGDLANWCFRQFVVQEVQKETRPALKALADVSKEIASEWTVTPTVSLFINGPEGKRVQIQHLVFYVKTSFLVEPLTVQHQTFGGAMISSATAELSELERIRFSLVQVPGKPVGRMIITNLARPKSRRRRGKESRPKKNSR